MKRALLTTAAVVLFSTSLWAADAAVAPSPATMPASSAPAADAAAPARMFMYVPKATDVVIGNETAPVTIVEYASLSCPHCAHFFNETMPALKEKYIDTGKAKLVYRDYPLNGPALQAALLVQCADKDRRHDFIKVLFKTQSKWAFGNDVKEALGNISVLGGVDRNKLDRCEANNDMERAIVAVRKEAEDIYKINSTPTFFINGQMHKGDSDINTMSVDIENALANSAKK